MKAALIGKSRKIATARVSKHRIFRWLAPHTVVTDAVVAIARDDDYFMGVLHSRPHELWSRAKGTQLREAESGFRYTPTSTFETFPFPWPPGQEPLSDPKPEAVAEVSRELHRLRDGWLNPPGASAADLEERTLTNLYNQFPSWLQMVHDKLDAAVFVAYGWPDELTDNEVLERLLALNATRQEM